MEERYVIGKFSFTSKEEYENGIKDLKYIKMLSQKLNLNDLNDIKKFLVAFENSKFEFKTEIGNEFISTLKKRIAVPSKEIQNKEIQNKEILNKEVLNKEVSNREVLNREVLNKEVLNKEVLNREVLNKEVLNKEVLNREVSNRKASNSELSNKVTNVDGNKNAVKHNQAYQNKGKVKKNVSVNPFIAYLPMVYIILLFLLPPAAAMIAIGIAIISGILAIVEYIANYKWYVIIFLVVSICLPPIGILLTLIAFIKKIKFIVLNGKMIFGGFVFYLGTAYLELQLFNLRYNQYGTPGIIDVINHWKELSRLDMVGYQVIMVITYVFICFIMLFISIKISNVFGKILRENLLRGITPFQTLIFIFKAPFTILLLFLPAILGSFAEDLFNQIIEDIDIDIDIDNNDHYVQPHTRHTADGKEVNVRGHYRMNPDDIDENNYSFKGK